VTDRAELQELIKTVGIVHGKVTLSSGREADYYIDLRRVTLHHAASPLVGRVMAELTADWNYESVGGLTLGADPVATSILHARGAEGGEVDAFVVRKAEKQHGMQQRIEGPSIAGRRVLIVEDVSTTGSSALAAVEAVREVGAEIVGVALIVDRGGVAAIEAAGLPCRAAFSPTDLGL
jgi:orotate phosphoribosyltransferase